MIDSDSDLSMKEEDNEEIEEKLKDVIQMEMMSQKQKEEEIQERI